MWTETKGKTLWVILGAWVLGVGTGVFVTLTADACRLRLLGPLPLPLPSPSPSPSPLAKPSPRPTPLDLTMNATFSIASLKAETGRDCYSSIRFTHIRIEHQPASPWMISIDVVLNNPSLTETCVFPRDVVTLRADDGRDYVATVADSLVVPPVVAKETRFEYELPATIGHMLKVIFGSRKHPDVIYDFDLRSGGMFRTQ